MQAGRQEVSTIQSKCQLYQPSAVQSSIIIITNHIFELSDLVNILSKRETQQNQRDNIMDQLFQTQKFQPRRDRHKSAKKRRPRSQEKIKPTRVVDTEANEDEGNPNCRIVAADKPNISIAGSDDAVSSENEHSPRQEESKDAHHAASAPPKTTEQVRVSDIDFLLQTLKNAKQLQVDGVNYAIDVDKRDFQNLLGFSKKNLSQIITAFNSSPLPGEPQRRFTGPINSSHAVENQTNLSSIKGSETMVNPVGYKYETQLSQTNESIVNAMGNGPIGVQSPNQSHYQTYTFHQSVQPQCPECNCQLDASELLRQQHNHVGGDASAIFERRPHFTPQNGPRGNLLSDSSPQPDHQRHPSTDLSNGLIKRQPSESEPANMQELDQEVNLNPDKTRQGTLITMPDIEPPQPFMLPPAYWIMGKPQQDKSFGPPQNRELVTVKKVQSQMPPEPYQIRIQNGAPTSSLLRKRPTLDLRFKYVPERYDDDPEIAAAAPVPFSPKLPKQPAIQRQKTKKPILNLRYTYNEQRYDDDPVKAANAPQVFAPIIKRKQTLAPGQREQKKPTLNIPFTYHEGRYDDDPKVADKAPQAFPDKKPRRVPPMQRQKTKKPKLKLNYKYHAARYDDDPKVAAKAPPAFTVPKPKTKTPKLALGFTFNEQRYDDDPEKAAAAPPAFKPQVKEKKHAAPQKPLQKKPTLKLRFKYVPQRYDDDPEVAKKAAEAFHIPHGKKPNLKLGYTYNEQRYDDDPKIAAAAPQAFEPKVKEKKNPASQKPLQKRPTLKLNYTYNEARYDDDPAVASSAPSPFQEQEESKAPPVPKIPMLSSLDTFLFDDDNMPKVPVPKEMKKVITSPARLNSPKGGQSKTSSDQRSIQSKKMPSKEAGLTDEYLEYFESLMAAEFDPKTPDITQKPKRSEVDSLKVGGNQQDQSTENKLVKRVSKQQFDRVAEIALNAVQDEMKDKMDEVKEMNVFDDNFMDFALSQPQRQPSLMNRRELKIHRETIKLQKELEASKRFKENQKNVVEVKKPPAKIRHPDHADLLFLHASPNLYEIQQNSKTIRKTIPLLDFLQEQRTIKQALDMSGCEVVFRSKVATRQNFGEMISAGLSVLHISCHGVKNTQTTMGRNYSQNQSVGHFLLFENNAGDGELFSAQEISKFMKKDETQLDVVFVAACDSEDIGEIFHKNGAKHVICVRTGRFVLDEAAIMFTKQFYIELFSKKSDVCTAFRKAVNFVDLQMGEYESNLFKKFTKDDLSPEEIDLKPWLKGKVTHVCEKLPHIDEMRQGMYKCTSEHNAVKILPNKLDRFKYRERDMSQLLKMLITDKERIVLLLGLHGIGKSALARNTCHYVAERKLFTGGIIFIQLKGMSSLFPMLKLIMREIIRKLDLTMEEKRALENDTFSENAMMEFFTDFFNRRIKQKFSKQKHCPKSKCSNNLFLLCLDNAGGMMEHQDCQDFVEFLVDLLDQCLNLRIIVTSNRDFQAGGNLNHKPWVLQSLKPNKSVELFFELCGPCDEEDVIQLILKDEKFPYEQFCPSAKKKSATNQEPRDREDVRRELKIALNGQGKHQLLAAHEMFRHLLGNPTSITMLASILQNPQATNTLVELYSAVKEERGLVITEYQLNFGKGGGHIKERVVSNIMSLNVAAEMSVRLLETSNKNDTNLLYFIGCLPGGVTEEQLVDMWGDDTQKCLKRLQKQPFFEVGIQKLMLTPTMINYIDSNMDLSSKQEYMHYICQFYLEILLKCYREIGKKALSDKDNMNNQDLPNVMNKMAQYQSQSHKIGVGAKQLSLRFSLQANSIAPNLRDGNNNSLEDEEEDDEKKYVGLMAAELQNIENCINFLIEASALQKTPAKKTKIATSAGYLSKEEESKGGASSAQDASTEQEDEDSGLTPKQIELKKNLSIGVNNPEYMQQHNISRSLTKSKIKVAQMVRTKTKRKYKMKNPLISKIGKKFRHSINQQLVSIKEEENKSFNSEDDDSFGTDDDMKNEEIKEQDEEGSSQFNGSTPQLVKEEQKQVDISMDSRKSGEEGLKKNYGVIRLGIGEDNIASDDDESFGSDSDFEDEEELMQRKATQKCIKEEIDQSQANAPAEEASNKSDDVMYNPESFKLLSKLIQIGFMNKMRKNRPSTKVTKEEFAQAQTSIEDLRSQFLTSVKTRRRVELGYDRKRSTCSRMSAIDMIDASSSAIGDQEIGHQFRRSFSTAQSIMTAWNPMTIEGQFILLMVADTYLTHDYEYSLRISETDFSFIANTCLFEGNILRFRALASLKLFEVSYKDHISESVQEDDMLDELQSDFNILTTALASLNNSLEIYEVRKNMSEINQHHYGMALSIFAMGYVYEEYAEYLTREHPNLGMSMCCSDHLKYLTLDFDDSRMKALQYYKHAYREFKKVEHLKGMQLCKKKIYDLMAVEFNYSDEEKQKAEQQMNLHDKKYKEYCTKQGIENSCHIPREQFGDEISLMVEITTRQVEPDKPLFPIVKAEPDISDEESSDSDSDSYSDQDGEDRILSLKKPQAPTISILNLAKAASATCSDDAKLEPKSGSSLTKVEQNQTNKSRSAFLKRGAGSMCYSVSPLEGLLNSSSSIKSKK